MPGVQTHTAPHPLVPPHAAVGVAHEACGWSCGGRGGVLWGAAHEQCAVAGEHQRRGAVVVRWRSCGGAVGVQVGSSGGAGQSAGSVLWARLALAALSAASHRQACMTQGLMWIIY